MTSLADGLPPEIAAQIHPDWRANEIAYWEAVNFGSLAEYEGLWVAFSDGQVVASDRNPLHVFHQAQINGRHPFVARVGAEHEPCRMRRGKPNAGFLGGGSLRGWRVRWGGLAIGFGLRR
ncbi:MAG: DUF5678 domain-containing protein [Fimbriiglobus sp.]